MATKTDILAVIQSVVECQNKHVRIGSSDGKLLRDLVYNPKKNVVITLAATLIAVALTMLLI